MMENYPYELRQMLKTKMDTISITESWDSLAKAHYYDREMMIRHAASQLTDSITKRLLSKEGSLTINSRETPDGKVFEISTLVLNYHSALELLYAAYVAGYSDRTKQMTVPIPPGYFNPTCTAVTENGYSYHENTSNASS